MVNSLEGVTWSDFHDLLQANYVQKTAGETLTVRMHSRDVTVAIPPGIRHLKVERPWLAEGSGEKLVVTAGCDIIIRRTEEAGSEPFAVENVAVVRIASEIANPRPAASVSPPPPSPFPIARKILMETRDRLSPMFHFMDRLRRPPNGA